MFLSELRITIFSVEFYNPNVNTIMILETKKVVTEYKRQSKLGVEHAYSRSKTVALIECDSCNSSFERELGKMDHRRLDNHYFHVCPNCSPKRFAQKKGVERRTIWNLPADSEVDISRL